MLYSAQSLLSVTHAHLMVITHTLQVALSSRMDLWQAGNLVGRRNDRIAHRCIHRRQLGQNGELFRKLAVGCEFGSAILILRFFQPLVKSVLVVDEIHEPVSVVDLDLQHPQHPES
jgi:hypothetical protein